MAKSYPCVNPEDKFTLHNGGMGVLLIHDPGIKIGKRQGDGFLFLWSSEPAIDRLIEQLQLMKKVLQRKNNPPGKEFKVASVSSNQNSFCLWGHILVAKDGEVWEAARANKLNKGDVIRVVNENWAAHGFEIPEKKPNMPENIVKEIWT